MNPSGSKEEESERTPFISTLSSLATSQWKSLPFRSSVLERGLSEGCGGGSPLWRWSVVACLVILQILLVIDLMATPGIGSGLSASVGMAPRPLLMKPPPPGDSSLSPSVASLADAGSFAVVVPPHPEGDKEGSDSLPTQAAHSQQQSYVSSPHCDGRRVFVYDYLPRNFSQDLIDNCQNPCDGCNSLCDAVQNNGIGLPLEGSLEDKYGSSSYGFGPWYGTQQNMVGVTFRARMSEYECVTKDWEEADAFYVPALFGLLTLYGAHLPYKGIEVLGEELESFLKYQPGFMRRGGKDHFMVLGQVMWAFFAEGPIDPSTNSNPWSAYLFKRPAFSKMLFVSVERFPWDSRTQAIPYATGFHPSNSQEIEEWVAHVKDHPRPQLVTLIAGRRGYVALRSLVISTCEKEKEKCKFIDCSEDCPKGTCESVTGTCGESRLVAKEYLSSEFCLMPNSDTATRRGTFEALVSGCIPVFFDSNSFSKQYSWYFASESPEKVSVLFDKEETEKGNLDFVAELEKISSEERSAMRERILRLIPSIVYRVQSNSTEGTNAGSQFKDAADLALEGILNQLGKKDT